MKFIAAVRALAFAGSATTAADNRAEMVPIPGGAFMMGSNDEPDDERPAHLVSVVAFEIDRLPVTNVRFAEFLQAAGTHNRYGERLYDFDDPDARIHKQGSRWATDKGCENHPAVEPSWPGARDYCVWRGKRLPPEAEWEKAARGTDGRKYPWGNITPDRSRAQFAARFNDPAPADAFPGGASPYGVLDMAGNTWE